MGEKETGAPAFELGSGVNELVRTGLRVEKPLTLSLGPIMGGKLRPGRYKVQLLLARPSVGDAVAELELRGSPAVRDTVRVASGKGRFGFSRLPRRERRRGPGTHAAPHTRCSVCERCRTRACRT